MRMLLRVVLIAAMTSTVALPVAAQPRGRPHPDPTFGPGTGWVTTSIRRWSLTATAVTTMGNGKVVVAGRADGPSNRSQILVARYRADGRLDRSFARRGVYRTSLPAVHGPYLATDVAVQPRTGKLVVGGGSGPGSMLVLRLTRRGRLDRTFGGTGTGMRITPVGGIAESLAVASDGKVLLGGSDGNRPGRPMVVARFLRDGRPDRKFGTNGLVRSRFWNASRAASSGVAGLAVARNGRVTASGHIDYIGGDGHGSAGVFRLTQRGRALRSFGDSGHVEIAFRPRSRPYSFWFPCAMVTDAKGRVTVTGDGMWTPTRTAILTARVSANGRLDRSFGHRGRSVVRGASDGGGTTCGAARTPDGGLTVGVQRWLLTLDRRGHRDQAFAPSGLRQIRTPAAAEIEAVGYDDQGRLVVAGGASRALYVARYTARPAREPGRGGRG